MNCFRNEALEYVCSLFLLGSVYLCLVSCFVFCVFPLGYCLVVSTSAVDCLERLISEMIWMSDIRTLSALSTRVPECQKLKKNVG